MKMKPKKIYQTVSFLCLIMLICNGNIYGQKKDKAVLYMDRISKEFKAISEDMWDYTSSAAHGKKARAVEARRKDLINQLTASSNKISHLPPYNDDASYRDSVVSFLKLNKIVLSEDYSKIVDMEDVAEQSYDAMEAYMLIKEKANEKLEAAGVMIDEEEKKFASLNGIKLIEEKDKIGKKLEESSKVYKYYNIIYLIFFKSFKQEVFLTDAQNKSDFNTMEQSKNALAEFSVAGQKKLAAIKDYKVDLSVKSTCIELLKFYDLETSKKYGDISNYFIQKEKYTKIKTSFEEKKESQRSKQEIDQYNLAINEFNKISDKFNKTNAELNTNRNKLIEKWNNTSNTFIDKHVPKKK